MAKQDEFSQRKIREKTHLAKCEIHVCFLVLFSIKYFEKISYIKLNQILIMVS